MATVIVALGSNLNNPHKQLKQARLFLESISDAPVLASSIYSSEPVGPSEYDFLNAVIVVTTEKSVQEVFEKIKLQEKKQGRPSRYPKWTARNIDLDIIAYDNLVLQTDNLIIPHAEYVNRLFVLLPLQEVLPNWQDIVSAQSIEELVQNAPDLRIKKTKLVW